MPSRWYTRPSASHGRMRSQASGRAGGSMPASAMIRKPEAQWMVAAHTAASSHEPSARSDSIMNMTAPTISETGASLSRVISDRSTTVKTVPSPPMFPRVAAGYCASSVNRSRLARRRQHRPEHDVAERAGHERADEDPDARRMREIAFPERQFSDEQRDGEADATQTGDAEDVTPADRPWQVCNPQDDGEPGEERDPDRLADDERRGHARRDRILERLGQPVCQRHAGVRKGEHRQDAERHPGVEAALEV